MDFVKECLKNVRTLRNPMTEIIDYSCFVHTNTHIHTHTHVCFRLQKILTVPGKHKQLEDRIKIKMYLFYYCQVSSLIKHLS